MDIIFYKNFKQELDPKTYARIKFICSQAVEMQMD